MAMGTLEDVLDVRLRVADWLDDLHSDCREQKETDQGFEGEHLSFGEFLGILYDKFVYNLNRSTKNKFCLCEYVCILHIPYI